MEGSVLVSRKVESTFQRKITFAEVDSEKLR